MVTGNDFKRFLSEAAVWMPKPPAAKNPNDLLKSQINNAFGITNTPQVDSNNNAAPSTPTELEPININKTTAAAPKTPTSTPATPATPSTNTVKPIQPVQTVQPIASSIGKAAGNVINNTVSNTTPSTSTDDDIKGAVAENPDKFQFGTKKGSGQVSSDELQKWRDSTGKAKGSLGQYMNDRDGKTAVKGGANDFDSVDGSKNSTVKLPSGATANIPLPPRPADIDKPVPKPSLSINANTLSRDVSNLPTTRKNSGNTNMSESFLINRFLQLHNSKNPNLFESAKKFVNGANGYHFTPNGTNTAKPAEKMPKLETKWVEKDLKSGHVNTKEKVPAQPMPKIKAKWIEKWLTGSGIHEELVQKAIDSLDEEMLNELEEGRKNYNLDKNPMFKSDKKDEKEKYYKFPRHNSEPDPNKKTKKLTKEELELAAEQGIEIVDLTEEAAPHHGEFTKGFSHGYTGIKPAGKATCHYFKGFEEGKREKRYDTESGKYHKGNADTIGNKRAYSYSNSYGMHSMYESVQEDPDMKDLFNEEELEYMSAILEDGEAPVKRGRGRPKGSKSGAQQRSAGVGGTGGNTDEEGNSYGTKNVAAQLRTTRPFFKNGVEHKTITHPETNKEHDIPLTHLNKFSDDYSDASKPADKLKVEKDFISKHMS